MIKVPNYGATEFSGQRFHTWTLDAFNPIAFGVSSQVVPSSAPQLVSPAGLKMMGTNAVSSISSWSVLQSPVPWIIIAILVGIPLYHWLEYEL